MVFYLVFRNRIYLYKTILFGEREGHSSSEHLLNYTCSAMNFSTGDSEKHNAPDLGNLSAGIDFSINYLSYEQCIRYFGINIWQSKLVFTFHIETLCFLIPQGTPVNIVVVSEPTDSTVLLEQHAEQEDYYLTMSVVMTVLCCIFGGWPSLVISAIAICISQTVCDSNEMP